MKNFLNLVVITFAMSFSFAAFAQKTLIVSKGAGYEPGLAKTWSASGSGKLVMQLDTTKEVARGKKLSAEMVKKNIEEKLKSGIGANVTVISGDKVEINYKATESELLKQLAKIRIRPESDVKLAAAGTVSDTGIRAKIAARDAKDGEAKVKILNNSEGVYEALILQAGKGGLPQGLKLNTKVKISGLQGESAESSIIIIKFSGAESGVWQVNEVN